MKTGASLIARSARTLGLLWALTGVIGCAAQAPEPVLVKKGTVPGGGVLVLKSSDNPVFDAPLESFMAELDSTVTVYANPDKIPPEVLRETVARLKPSLVFALGTKATLVSRRALPDTPLLFAMVVNYRRHQLTEQNNVMGIALETPPAVEFMMFKMVAADMKKVLAFYNPKESGDLVEEAREAVAGLGVELVAVPVDNAAAVKQAYADKPAEVDGVWFMNDPVVMNPQTFAFLKDQTQAQGLPFFSSLSDRFAQGGALMSVSVDLTTLGSQAAAMARSVSEGTAPSEVGIQPPIGSKLVVNLDVAKRIGFAIPEDVLPFINEVIVGRAEGSEAP